MTTLRLLLFSSPLAARLLHSFTPLAARHCVPSRVPCPQFSPEYSMRSLTLRFFWLRDTLLGSLALCQPLVLLVVRRCSGSSTLSCSLSPYSPGCSILFSVLGSLLVTWCSRLTSQHHTIHSASSRPLGIRTTESSWLPCALLVYPSRLDY